MQTFMWGLKSVNTNDYSPNTSIELISQSPIHMMQFVSYDSFVLLCWSQSKGNIKSKPTMVIEAYFGGRLIHTKIVREI